MNKIQIINYFGNNINPDCGGVNGSEIFHQSQIPCSRNNGILSKKGSMPAKFQTADNSQTFSLARKSYVNVANCSRWVSRSSNDCNIPVVRVDSKLSDKCQTPITDPKWSARKIKGNGNDLYFDKEDFKKYQNSNGKITKILDNSELIRRKKTLAIGSSSNLSKVNDKNSFKGYAPNMNNIITNVANQSLRRVRNSGYIVPPKVTGQKPCSIIKFHKLELMEEEESESK